MVNRTGSGSPNRIDDNRMRKIKVDWSHNGLGHGMGTGEGNGTGNRID